MAQTYKLPKSSPQNVHNPTEYPPKLKSLMHGKNLSRGCDLLFKNINTNIGEKAILKGINGLAKPGEILAIMGPSGAGKTTLLNCLAGRRGVDSGEITMNSKPLTKQLRRKISYVLQQDIFLSNLSYWDTLWYTAMLRLPGSMPKAEKEKRVYEITDVLNMRKCLHTKIGDNLIRGLSGGEKKRTTIACELLTNPVLMLLDEPTSGLDSSTAFDLCATIKQYARSSNKTVIMTIHQPSSQIFNMFDKLLLLCEGQVAYYGSVKGCADYFKELEIPCPANYNLADHILDVAKSSSGLQLKIVEEAAARVSAADWYQLDKLQTGLDQAADPVRVEEDDADIDLCSTDRQNRRSGFANGSFSILDEETGAVKFSYRTASLKNAEDVEDGGVLKRIEYTGRWPTSFWLQYSVLVRRSFRQDWPKVFNRWNLIYAIVLGTLTGMLWFQIDATEETIRDRQGLLFFLAIELSFASIIRATISFQSEREILNKERLAGYYRLSAYYLAKISSDLPLAFVIPSIISIIAYWLAGLSLDFLVFLQMIGCLLLTVIVSHGIGGFSGILISETSVALLFSTGFMVFSMLAGGFFTSTIPYWGHWMKYISFATYTFNAMLHIEYSNVKIRCATIASIYPACINHTHLITNNSDSTYLDKTISMSIPAADLLEKHTMSSQGWLIWHHLLVLTGIVLLFRLAAYLILRFVRKPHIA